MNDSATDMSAAFPASQLLLARGQIESGADLYNVMRVEDDALHLEADASDLRYPAPVPDEIVTIQFTLSPGIGRAKVRILSCTTGEQVRVVATQHGPLERVNRRERTRLRLGLAGRLRIENDAHEIAFQTKDINSHGLRFENDRALQPGVRCRLWLDLGSAQPAIECDARVARCSPDGAGRMDVGIAFDNLSQERRERLIDFLVRQMLVT